MQITTQPANLTALQAIVPSGTGTGAASNMPVLNRFSEFLVSEWMPRYYAAAMSQNMYTLANTAGQTTSAGTTTAFVGLVLANPPTNNKSFVITKVSLGFNVVFGAIANVGIMAMASATAFSPTATGSSIASTYQGAAINSAAKYGTSASLPVAPTYIKSLGQGLTGAVTTIPYILYTTDLEGSLILPPGGYLCTYTSAASGASAMFASFDWLEVPV